MTYKRRERPNNVTPGLENVDAFAARPLILDARGRNVTRKFKQPEWSAFRPSSETRTSRLPRTYKEKLALTPSRHERDRIRRREKLARRQRAIEQRQRSSEKLAEVRCTFKNARRAKKRSIERIEQCILKGDDSRARKLQRVYLRSFSAKLMAFEQANNKLRPRFQLTAEQLVEEARRLDAFAPESEPVRLRWITKDNSPTRLAYKLRWKDHRLIQSFGVRHKARQYLCKAALEPFLLPALRGDQTGVQGADRSFAINKLVEAVENGELRYFLELDIENFFPNIGAGNHNRNGDSIYHLEDWLPVPDKVIQTCVLTKHNTVDLSRIPSTDTLSQRLDSQKGVPQGSATSPLIASYVMAKLLDELDQHLRAGTHLVSYVDNVGIYGSEPAALMFARLALMRECFRSRFGTLRLKERFRLVRADEGFDFLGYRIHRVVIEGSPTAVISVSEKGLIKFRREVRQRLKNGRISSFCPDCAERRETVVSSLREFIQGWCASYSCVPDIRKTAEREADRAASGVGLRHFLRAAFEQQ